ncbi:hypothetical protein WA026_005433 [Henosepilachna vigintioctopunctata]|uniref:Protein takeout-like n=1 Tax=Henosepilachna vigintioctopunctata TaxID=420089 RepID=A0AAW1TSR4_9CUCU
MYIFTFIFLVSIFLSAECRKFPESLKHLRCSKTDNLSACIVKNGNLAIPIVAEGLPEVNSQKFNPMKLPFVQLISTSSISLNLSDVTIYGLDEMKIEQAMVDLKLGVFSTLLRGKNVTIDGNYIVSGQVLLLPIRGSGRFSVYLKDGIYNSTLNSEVIERDGIKYIRSTGNHLTYNFKLVQFKLDNLFDGNKQLGDEMNKFLNENWKLILDDFGPGIANTISHIHKKNFNDFVSDIPITEIYLE